MASARACYFCRWFFPYMNEAGEWMPSPTCLKPEGQPLNMRKVEALTLFLKFNCDDFNGHMEHNPWKAVLY